MRALRPVLLLAVVSLAAACGDGPPSSVFNAAGYYVRGETVYYLRAFPGEAFEIEGADAKTFEIIDTTYAKDAGSVYIDGAPLAEADPATFELLEDNYSKDAGHVFLRSTVLTEDVDAFEFLESGGLTKDSTNVYWSDGSVLSEDPDNFVVLSDADFYLFTADSSTVFVNGNPIEGADPASFEVYGGAYAKDARQAYYFTDVIADADAASFELLEGPYARDAAHAYWMGNVVTGAEPDSFVVLNANFECTADATQAFYQDGVIEGFDPSTIPVGATVTNCSETSLSHDG